MNKTYFYIFIFCVSCNLFEGEKVKKDAGVFREGTKSIKLDSLTPHYNYSMELSTHENKKILCFINDKEFTIYINDWATGEIVKRIPLNKEGPNAIPYSGLEGVCVEGLNRYLIFCPDVFTFYRIDDKGTILKRYNLKDYSEWGNQYRGWPRVSASNPLLRLDRNSYLLQSDASTYKVNDYTNVYITHKLTFDDKLKIEPLLKYSPIYNKGNWGDYLPFHTFSTLNHKDKLIYTSFARDDSIQILDFSNSQMVTRYAGSYYFSNDKIKAINKEPGIEYVDRSQQILHDFTTPMYKALLYDSVNRFIYRIVRNEPPSRELVSRNGGNFRLDQGYAIIVLDEAFNKLGEFSVEKNRYSGEAIFVENGKIYWLLNASSQQNENELSFDIFDFSELRS